MKPKTLNNEKFIEYVNRFDDDEKQDMVTILLTMLDSIESLAVVYKCLDRLSSSEKMTLMHAMMISFDHNELEEALSMFIRENEQRKTSVRSHASQLSIFDGPKTKRSPL